MCSKIPKRSATYRHASRMVADRGLKHEGHEDRKNTKKRRGESYGRDIQSFRTIPFHFWGREAAMPEETRNAGGGCGRGVADRPEGNRNEPGFGETFPRRRERRRSCGEGGCRKRWGGTWRWALGIGEG